MANAEAGSAPPIFVEVVYATPLQQTLIPLQVPPGTTIVQAIALSSIGERHPEIDLTTQAVGIFGERTSLERVLHDGDRIEIYRPLQADPKQARRRRAASKDQRTRDPRIR